MTEAMNSYCYSPWCTRHTRWQVEAMLSNTQVLFHDECVSSKWSDLLESVRRAKDEAAAREAAAAAASVAPSVAPRPPPLSVLLNPEPEPSSCAIASGLPPGGPWHGYFVTR